MNESLLKEIRSNVNKRNNLEERLSYEMFGCSFNELDYDEKEEVIFEAEDRI